MTGIKAHIIEQKNREHPIVFWQIARQIAKKKVIYIIYLSIYFNLKKI